MLTAITIITTSSGLLITIITQRTGYSTNTSNKVWDNYNRRTRGSTCSRIAIIITSIVEQEANCYDKLAITTRMWSLLIGSRRSMRGIWTSISRGVSWLYKRINLMEVISHYKSSIANIILTKITTILPITTLHRKSKTI